MALSNSKNETCILNQLHIDIARNSTDDFNLFHDQKKWQKISGNPFNGPIMLGFQLESLIESRVKSFRARNDENKIIIENKLNFSNYQFSFINAVKPDQIIEVNIKKTQFNREPDPVLSNRISLCADGKIALMGFKKETDKPLYLADAEFSELQDLLGCPDRSFLSESDFFLKRKFMATSNAKNFLCSSLVDQTEYFDEIQGKVIFPEIFPCALLSSALLEKAIKKNHDFERFPMVYSSHKISIDKRLLARLRSTDPIHIIIRQEKTGLNMDFGDNVSVPLSYQCYGLEKNNATLFRAIITLAPLEWVIKGKK